MAPIKRGGTVAVTGATGYVGGWIVQALLDRGYRVRGCVRDADHVRAAFLRSMPGHASSRLTLHSCDLRVPGACDDAFRGCHGVVHAAADPDLPLEQRVEVYQEVSRCVIAGVARSGSVTRVVFTSSAAAIAGDQDLEEYKLRPVIDEDRYPNLENPSNKPLEAIGYTLGKIESERLFQRAAEASGGGWDVVITNPADNLGPLLSRHHAEAREVWTPWHCRLARLLEGGDVPQAPLHQPWWPVDVRDTAEAHVRLLESGAAVAGGRYFLSSGRAVRPEDLGRLCAEVLPEACLIPSMAPGGERPEGPGKPQGPEAAAQAVWDACRLCNDKICRDVGMTFRPLEDTLRDCVESLLALSALTPRRGGEAGRPGP